MDFESQFRSVPSTWPSLDKSFPLKSNHSALPTGLAVPDTEGRLHRKPQQGTSISGKGLTDLSPVAGVQEVAVGRLLQAQPQVYQAPHHHLDLCKATRRSSAHAGPGHRRQSLLRAGYPAPGTVRLWKQDREQAEHQGSGQAGTEMSSGTTGFP